MLTEATLDQQASELRPRHLGPGHRPKRSSRTPISRARTGSSTATASTTIRQNGFTEQGFVATSATSSAPAARRDRRRRGARPAALRDAVNRFRNESRSAEYFTLRRRPRRRDPGADRPEQLAELLRRAQGLVPRAGLPQGQVARRSRPQTSRSPTPCPDAEARRLRPLKGALRPARARSVQQIVFRPQGRPRPRPSGSRRARRSTPS